MFHHGRILTLSTTFCLLGVGATQAQQADRGVPIDVSSSRAPRSPNTASLLRGVHLVTFDPPRVTRDADVLVVGRSIVALGATGSIVAPPEARTIEGRGGYLLPGLIDVHVHVDTEADLPLWLAHGVTTVRNMSGSPQHLEWRRLIARGEIDGPRLLTSSPGMSGTFHDSPTSFHAESAAVAAEGLARFAEQGYDLIKTYRFDREVFDAVVAAARNAGIAVAGHLHDRIRDPLEILPEMDSVSHLDELLWFAFGPEVENVDLEGFARAVQASGAAVETLLTPAFLGRRGAEAGPAFLAGAEAQRIRAYAGADDFGSLKATVEGAKDWSASRWARRRVPRAFLLGAIKALVDAGVTVLPGTDSQSYGAVAGISLLEELDLMVEAGLTPAQALEAATSAAARLLGLDDKVGSLAVGLDADFVLVAGDPLEGLAALRTPWGVMARGRWYDAADLERLGAPPYAD